ncbi:ATP-binding protein [Phaeocystidibacter marisrubri]|uniref:histidine kinase n=1 Tax=Phaeocystidibacter marisrubri TaxID=1577780 RepID=A0A6L3ZFJ2_9FLAO|nr:tetratricopeptide repeat protein [Phaeocystidibacter marisrubri]KAB2816503.1 tetratricopeptide repeat protein [Phaeocystidibacter marisrubri]
MESILHRLAHACLYLFLLILPYSSEGQNEQNEYVKHLRVLDSLIEQRQFDKAIQYTNTQQPSSEIIQNLFVHQRNRALLKNRQSPKSVEIECLEAHHVLHSRTDSISVYLDARILELLGHYYYQQSELFTALSYLDSASIRFKEINDYLSTIYNLNMIGTIYDLNGEKAKSVRYYHRALSEFEEHPIDSSYYFEIIIDLGNLYYHLSQYDKADELYRTVYENPALFEYPKIVADVYTNLGNVSQERGLFPESEYFYQQAFKYFTQLNDSTKMAMVLHNIGALKEETDTAEALDYYKRSLLIKQRFGDHAGMANTKYAIARLYFLNDQNSRSKELAFEAIDNTELGYDSETVSLLYELLGSIYAKEKNWQQAFLYTQKYRSLSDSIRLLDEQATIHKIEQLYHIEEQKKIINNLEKSDSQKQAQLKKSKVINYALGGATVLLIIVLVLLMSNFQQMQRTKNTLYTKNLEITAAEALMKGQEEERQRLAHELHDKVGNHITVLKNHVVTHRNGDETLLKIVQDMSAEVRNISQDLMPPVLERFGLADALEELCTRYRDQTEATIDLNIDQSEAIPMDRDEQINLYRLIQELIQVSLYHYKANYLLIEMLWNESGVWVNIEDNGVKKQRYNDGDRVLHPWKPIEHRVQFLKGDFIRSSHNQGNEYRIYIPNQKQ